MDFQHHYGKTLAGLVRHFDFGAGLAGPRPSSLRMMLNVLGWLRAQEEILLRAYKHPDSSNVAIARAVGCTDRTVRKWRSRSRASCPPADVPALLGCAWERERRRRESIFDYAAVRHFGSRWVFLVINPVTARSEIWSPPILDSVLSTDLAGLLCCDEWEHAYYLEVQEPTSDYVAAW